MPDKNFTTKDIDKIKKELDKANAKRLKAGDIIELTYQEVEALMKMDRWATGVLEEAEKLHKRRN